ncbi:MAG: trypsin-like peptidase domain-containing protein [Halieaceae bacterium]|nr:trypsin-like peptidase domain-containing protein [Halieaceae bacterium]
MKKLVQFITWPALAGVLAGMVLLQWQTNQRTESVPASVGVSFAGAVQRAAPSVVNIYTSKRIRSRLADDPFLRRFFGNNIPSDRYQRSLGSGVIVAEEGLVLTNRHVIAGADEIVVLLQDGRDSRAAVVGSDPDTDLAVLRIQIEDIPPISMGNPDELQVGDVVLAIGNPFGFGNSVSQGIVSALGRYGLNLSTYEDYIQTDAAVHKGNSGGALITTNGKLVGINTAIYSQTGAAMGIGLAIPSDLALQVMDSLVNYGKVIRGWMGLEVQPLFDGNREQTLTVTAVATDGPAGRAGIQVGDVITHINTSAVVDGRSTMQQVALLRPGDAVEVTLLRRGKTLNLPVVVGMRPESSER